MKINLKFIQINAILTNKKSGDDVMKFIEKTPAFIHSIKYQTKPLIIK